MSIKSDKWIRRMATEFGMIEPFEPDQVREVDGQRVVSYGTSSYGYDIRCADEFKLFTNVYSAIVDPKNFNPQSFVDVKGNHVIIPPNSFALARTVEYFRIPRNVLTICLGKSTYARCFRGDTRVALSDGTAPTLEEMARRADDGQTFTGYSINARGQMIVSSLEAPRFIGRDALLEVVLDNERSVYCTPDHQFMLRDYHMVAADDLRPGDSLMSLPTPTTYNQKRNRSSSSARTSNNHSAAKTKLTHRNFHPAELDTLQQSSITLNAHSTRTTRNTDVSTYVFRSQFLSEPVELFSHDLSTPQHTLNTLQSLRHPLNQTCKVRRLRALAGDHDVYCLTVPEAGNFALDAGIFVHNCGIIVNVTPFEPEWEGYVTLEFSNTTPMPAKIYANEGIAQVLFFESDEVCETSYKDKGGKYQGQQGVTPPKL